VHRLTDIISRQHVTVHGPPPKEREREREREREKREGRERETALVTLFNKFRKSTIITFKMVPF
jgi:hypothetical protein